MTTPSAVVASQQDSDAATTPREGSGRRLRRRLRPGLGVVFGIAAFLTATLQLLLHPVLGLADNGDYKRILVYLHLSADVPPGLSSSCSYIWLRGGPGGPSGPY